MPYFLEFGYYNTALLSSFQDFLGTISDIVQIYGSSDRLLVHGYVYAPVFTAQLYSSYYTFSSD